LGDEFVKDGGEALEFVKVGCGQLAEPILAVGGEPDAGDAAVAAVAPALHQPGGLGAINQFDRAVRPEQQVGGQVADGGAIPAAVALDGQQQLMLGRGQAGRARPSLGPVLKAAQARPEREQVLIVLAGELAQPVTAHGGLRSEGIPGVRCGQHKRAAGIRADGGAPGGWPGGPAGRNGAARREGSAGRT